MDAIMFKHLTFLSNNVWTAVKIFLGRILSYSNFISRFLASLLVEVGEYDISGPNEMMSTKEMKVNMINDNHQMILMMAIQR